MADRHPSSGPAVRIAGAAALIAVLTVLSRIAGFGRTMLFAWAVGDNDLGDIYFAANLIPNIVFEIVAGGALASLVVPLLAGAVAVGDRAAVARTTSALLTWTLALLLPLSVGLAVAAHPVVAALSDADGPQVAVGALMLRLFAPQLPLYGAGIVFTGVLQAHRRFAWPVLAPLLSSLTVAAAYLTFVAVDARGVGVAELSTAGLLTLALGTTAGVVVLAGCLVPPVRRLGVRVRPRWRLDPVTRRRVLGLAAAGGVTVAAQHLALLVAVWRGLAGPDGTWVLFMLAQTIFLLPWAVLAVPLATAVYPGLAEATATGDQPGYRAMLARTTRQVLLLSSLGAAALAGLARPIATLLGLLMPHAGLASVDRLTAGIIGFAPGVVGYGLFAVLSRALYARGETRAAGAAAITGWTVVAGATVVLAALLPHADRVLALTAATSIGMTVLGAALLIAVARSAGRGALVGLARTGPVGLLAALVAAGAGGWSAVRLLPANHPPALTGVLGSGMLAGVVVAVVFVAITWWLDRQDLRPVAASIADRLRARRRSAARPSPQRSVMDTDDEGVR